MCSVNTKVAYTLYDVEYGVQDYGKRFGMLSIQVIHGEVQIKVLSQHIGDTS